MKKRKALFALLLCTLILGTLNSCDKKEKVEDKSIDIPQTSKPYIKMKVNGEWWVADGAGSPKPMVGTYLNDPPNYPVDISGTNTSNHDSLVFLSIIIQLGVQLEIGTYNAVTSSAITYFGFGLAKQGSGTGTYEGAYENYKGMVNPLPFTITINKIAPSTIAPYHFIEGTFEGQMADVNGNIITITEGEFAGM